METQAQVIVACDKVILAAVTISSEAGLIAEATRIGETVLILAIAARFCLAMATVVRLVELPGES